MEIAFHGENQKVGEREKEGTEWNSCDNAIDSFMRTLTESSLRDVLPPGKRSTEEVSHA